MTITVKKLIEDLKKWDENLEIFSDIAIPKGKVIIGIVDGEKDKWVCAEEDFDYNTRKPLPYNPITLLKNKILYFWKYKLINGYLRLDKFNPMYFKLFWSKEDKNKWKDSINRQYPNIKNFIDNDRAFQAWRKNRKKYR